MNKKQKETLLKKYKSKLKAHEERSSGSRDKVRWSPSEGRQVIRILPGVHDDEPFKEFSFHYNVGKAYGFLCPKRNFGDACPVCDFASEMWKVAKEQGDEEKQKIIQRMFAKERYYSLVLVREEEDEGAKWYGYSASTYRALMQMTINLLEEGIDLTDQHEGLDVILNYEKVSGKQFYDTNLDKKTKCAPLVDDEKRVKEIFETAPEFSRAFQKKSTQEVQEILNRYLLDEDDAEEVSSEETKFDSGNEKVKEALNELLEA